MRRILVLGLCVATALLAEGPEFEVASIKPTPNQDGLIVIAPARGGPGTADPTHINWTSATLKNIVMNAFDVRNFQVVGPDDLDRLRFDVVAGVPEGATKQQVAIMWRNLLTSRFKMKYHVEQRDFNVDELTVLPRGHKLTENTDPAAALPQGPRTDGPGGGPPGPPEMDKNGRPILTRPGMAFLMGIGDHGITARAAGKGQQMSALIQMISNQVGHPVIDKTGLTGRYDFNLEFVPVVGPGGAPLIGTMGPGGPGTGPKPPSPTEAVELGLDLPTALQQQLGLRLAKGNGKLDVIVVEKIERTPTEN